MVKRDRFDFNHQRGVVCHIVDNSDLLWHTSKLDSFLIRIWCIKNKLSLNIVPNRSNKSYCGGPKTS